MRLTSYVKLSLVKVISHAIHWKMTRDPVLLNFCYSCLVSSFFHGPIEWQNFHCPNIGFYIEVYLVLLLP